VYKTASIEILEDSTHTCDTELECKATATYNVYDGVYPLYACGHTQVTTFTVHLFRSGRVLCRVP
jgi:hypothetical protein